ncbi:MAG: glucose-1-phosphate thymidylyltransferase [Limisphaerales bacterium]|jgi:glucose-1-phosphate thymidylyltransferase
MKLIILAAGYATRLYPRTLNCPKPLLEIAGRPMIEHVIERVFPSGGIDQINVVTNNKFAGHFKKWAAGFTAPAGCEIIVINDQTTDDTNKLGAIGDAHLVIQKQAIEDDLLIVAGDNLFSEDLVGFGEFCREKDTPVLGLFDVGSLEETKKYSEVQLDEAGCIANFVEKPKNPKTSLIGIALYYYPKAFVPRIEEYIQAGHNPDQPGRLIQWLYPQTPVHTWTVPGSWYDIGSEKTLEQADREFSQE